MLIKKKLILVFIFCIFNLSSFSQNIDSIFKSLDNNFNKSLESQIKCSIFILMILKFGKTVNLNNLSLVPEKAQKITIPKQFQTGKK